MVCTLPPVCPLDQQNPRKHVRPEATWLHVQALQDLKGTPSTPLHRPTSAPLHSPPADAGPPRRRQRQRHRRQQRRHRQQAPNGSGAAALAPAVRVCWTCRPLRCTRLPSAAASPLTAGAASKVRQGAVETCMLAGVQGFRVRGRLWAVWVCWTYRPLQCTRLPSTVASPLTAGAASKVR